MSLLTSQVPYQADSPTSSSLTNVWAVGDWQAAEFQAALAPIAELGTWQFFQTLSAAVAALESCACGPELILLAQPLPNSVAQETVRDFRLAMPLSRIIAVAGSWCEGELRTGRPLAGIPRLYWYELGPWWMRARRALQSGRTPPWSAMSDSVLVQRSVSVVDQAEKSSLGPVLVDSGDYATFETLAAALSPYGAECQWNRTRGSHQESGRLQAGIWVGSQLEEAEILQLQQFAQRVRQQGGQTVALLDFPRWQHAELVKHCGCIGMMGMPYIVEELVAMLCEGDS